MLFPLAVTSIVNAVMMLAASSVLRSRSALITLSCILFSSSLSAQAIPLRDVDRPSATSVDRFVRIGGVRELLNGSVVVNDYGRRQLLSIDQTLGAKQVLLDSQSVNIGYGRQEAMLAPFIGDSIMLISRYALSVVDSRTGRLMRWGPARTYPLIGALNPPTVGLDANGNYVFRASVSQRPPAGAAASDSTAKPTVGPGTDSGVVVRANFTTRAITPAARLFQQPLGKISMDKAADGRMIARTVINVLPLVDEFAILSDGTIAVLRASDYHIDFIDSDGKVESAPKLPFPFVNLTEGDRQALIDSARTAQAAADATGQSTMAREGAAVAAGVAVAKATGLNGTKPGDGFSVDVKQTGALAAGTVTANPGQALQGTLPFATRAADIEYVPAERLPSRIPAFRGGRTMSVDLNDNIWIQTTAKDPSLQGGVMYDVVSRSGKLEQRVRIPAGRTIAGFGRNGDLYLAFKDDVGFGIERVAVRR